MKSKVWRCDISVLLWYGDGDDDAISLGSILHVFPAWKEISQALAGAGGFEELESVPGFAEQMVTPWWLGQVRSQASRFLREHGRAVSDQTSRILGHLVSHIEAVPRGRE